MRLLSRPRTAPATPKALASNRTPAILQTPRNLRVAVVVAAAAVAPRQTDRVTIRAAARGINPETAQEVTTIPIRQRYRAISQMLELCPRKAIRILPRHGTPAVIHIAPVVASTLVVIKPGAAAVVTTVAGPAIIRRRTTTHMLLRKVVGCRTTRLQAVRSRRVPARARGCRLTMCPRS